MEPKIIVKPKFNVIGYAIKTTIKDGQNHKEIPAFWQDYLKRELYHTIPNKKVENVEYGLCTEFSQEDGSLTYIICTEVTSFDGASDQMECRTIPEAKYAVFTTPKATEEEFSHSISNTWNYIFSEWFPKSDYEHSGAPEFELYDSRCYGPVDKQIDIYIPIAEKK